MSVSWRMGRLSMWPVCFGIVCGLLIGCGGTPSSGNRIAVGGKVTRAGQPVVKANIIFQPVNGKDAQGSGGDVYNGEYRIPAESGPTPGQRYKVTVMTQPEKFMKDAPGERKATQGPGNEKQYVLEKEVDIPQKETTSLDLVFE